MLDCLYMCVPVCFACAFFVVIHPAPQTWTSCCCLSRVLTPWFTNLSLICIVCFASLTTFFFFFFFLSSRWLSAPVLEHKSPLHVVHLCFDSLALQHTYALRFARVVLTPWPSHEIAFATCVWNVCLSHLFAFIAQFIPTTWFCVLYNTPVIMLNSHLRVLLFC